MNGPFATITGVNLNTAMTIGIAIPNTLLAAGVIE
jgi:hypothetical protein